MSTMAIELTHTEEASLRSFLNDLREEDLNDLLNRWNSSRLAKRQVYAALSCLHRVLQSRQSLTLKSPPPK